MQYKYYKMINKKIGHEENEPCGGGSVRGKEGKVALAKGGDENALKLEAMTHFIIEWAESARV